MCVNIHDHAPDYHLNGRPDGNPSTFRVRGMRERISSDPAHPYSHAGMVCGVWCVVFEGCMCAGCVVRAVPS